MIIWTLQHISPIYTSVYNAAISCLIEGKLVSLFDKPEGHNTMNVDFSCEEAGGSRREGISSQSFRKLSREALPGGLTQCVNTLPREAGGKSGGKLVMPAHIW